MTAEVDAVRNAARSHAPDFYLSALLAPRSVRSDLVTLAAYLGEIARVPLTASEPALGAIRTQAGQARRMMLGFKRIGNEAALHGANCAATKYSVQCESG